MKRRITMWAVCLIALIVWSGSVFSQAAKPSTLKTVKLPSGEEVFDLSGDWDAFVENYGERAHYGIYPQVWRITQTGSTFSCIRIKDNPLPSSAKAGSPCLRGELDKTGFNKVWTVDPNGTPWEGKGQISEDGKKLVIDNERHVKVTLTKSGDRTPLVGIWRLFTFQLEYQATGKREYPKGAAATGYILFLPEGRMAVVITGEGRKAPATDQDRAGLFNSLVAYTGPYRVDGDKWITTVEVSANPAWVGTEQIRSFKIDGNRLQESTALMPFAAQPEKGMVRYIITYEKMK